MKTLLIVRHAKSSWNDPSLDDFDRPLNDRGKKDAPKMGKRLRKRGITPTLLLSSPARRALDTARAIAREVGYPETEISTQEKLYHAGEDTIADVIRGIAERHQVVLVFGHNPGMTDFVNMLVDDADQIKNIPTCGIVTFQVKGEWKNFSAQNAEFALFDYPKNHD